MTTSLQPARDGVGDYTSCLASACQELGHEVFRMALNDSHLQGALIDENSARWGGDLPWKNRASQASKALVEFGPDLISLQFVCYGFHRRGLAWALAGRLKAMFREIPVQITFHELWIGGESGAGLKDRIVGELQRWVIMSVIDRLRPRLVHTTNPAYVALLKQNQVASIMLPLFGAVPVPENSAVVRSRLDWNLGMFGSLHPVWSPEPLFERLLGMGRKLTLTHIGNIGPGKGLWEQMKAEYGDRIAFETTGELTATGVSEAFKQIDFGIATTPWEIIGKSASVAAMLEHGLPVIVNRDDVHYRGWKEEGYSPLLIKMGRDLKDRLEHASRQAPRSIRTEVAIRFLDDLRGVL